MKIKQTIQDFQKRWAVIFLHTNGWTISSIHDRRLDAEVELTKNKETCPNFKYRVVKLNTLTFNI